MAGIFVSYRRVEAQWANRLSRHLGNRFGNDLVFQDVDDILGAEQWRDKISAAISDAEIILVVIGPHWLLDPNRGRRLDDPQDVLRNEIAAALAQNKLVMSVLVGGARMPNSGDLPETIAALTDRNAMELREAHWNQDIGHLLDRIRDLLRPTRSREPLQAIQWELYRQQQQFFAVLEQDQDPAGALDIAQRTFLLLNRVTPLYPANTYLQALRGYTHKNLAIALYQLEREGEARANLAMADQVFSTLQDEFPNEPSAWDGKGSVEFMRKHLEEALYCFDRALKLKPDYQEAQQNRSAVLAALRQRKAES